MGSDFFGKWFLIAEKSEYAQGEPPKSAIYEIKQGKDHSLDIAIKWIDFEGKEFDIEYNTIPDGKRKKIEKPEIANEVMSEFASETVLNSYTYKGKNTIAFASRIIDEQGIMKVVQRHFSPKGKYFDNVQYYSK